MVDRRDLEAVSNALFHDITGNVHRDAIEGAFEYGLVEGTRYPCGDGGGRYSPNRSLQRQQAASVLACAIATFDAIEAGEVERRQAEPECPTPVWLPRIETAATYAEQRSGSVSFAAIGTDGQLVGHRAATPRDRDLLEPMLRWSANEPATRIADMVGPTAMNRLAERACMRDFSYARPWGNSRTSARDQTAFLLAFDRYVPSRHRAYAPQLLTEVVPHSGGASARSRRMAGRSTSRAAGGRARVGRSPGGAASPPRRHTGRTQRHDHEQPEPRVRHAFPGRCVPPPPVGTSPSHHPTPPP